MGQKTEERGTDEELVDGQNPDPEASPRSKNGREEGAKKMSGEKRLPKERGRRVGVLESLRRRGSEGVMAVEIPKMRTFLEGKKEGEKELVLPSVGKEQIGGAYTLRKESKEELFREMLTST